MGHSWIQLAPLHHVAVHERVPLSRGLSSPAPLRPRLPADAAAAFPPRLHLVEGVGLEAVRLCRGGVRVQGLARQRVPLARLRDLARQGFASREGLSARVLTLTHIHAGR
jgi:hypothetical protein